MKAVVKYGKGKGLIEIREVPEPKMKDDDVLIEVKAVSVCGSDLHIFHDSHPYWPPVVLGHEFSGILAQVGAAVIGFNGAYAKYVAGPAKLLHRLPEHVPFDVAAVTEPIAVCVTSILERCRL